MLPRSTKLSPEPLIAYHHMCFYGIHNAKSEHDDIIKWKHFPPYWPFMLGINRSLVNSPHKGQWRGALIFSLICAWINNLIYNREAGDLRCHHAHYDVIVMKYHPQWQWQTQGSVIVLQVCLGWFVKVIKWCVKNKIMHGLPWIMILKIIIHGNPYITPYLNISMCIIITMYWRDIWFSSVLLTFNLAQLILPYCMMYAPNIIPKLACGNEVYLMIHFFCHKKWCEVCLDMNILFPVLLSQFLSG